MSPKLAVNASSRPATRRVGIDRPTCRCGAELKRGVDEGQVVVQKTALESPPNDLPRSGRLIHIRRMMRSTVETWTRASVSMKHEGSVTWPAGAPLPTGRAAGYA